MKILFAVNNDNVSDAIVKKYQNEFKEILSYKNVYYFNAILRELQKDKTYSRIVISEDLEPFANNNYDSIDKFLFDKYCNIVDEAKGSGENKIDIILICADRRKRTDSMLAKIYKKGIYNAIIGQDRSIGEICRLIYSPRDKEEAQRYYNIQESELGDSQSEDNVSEAEIENIRAHYARLGRNEDKYLESFNNIVSQYSDTQLRIIIKYLPMNVKAVLEERSPKYQQLVTTSAMAGIDLRKKTEKFKEKTKNRAQEVERQSQDDEVIGQLMKKKKIKSVVIPENIGAKSIQKITIPKVEKPDIQINELNYYNKNEELEEQLDHIKPTIDEEEFAALIKNDDKDDQNGPTIEEDEFADLLNDNDEAEENEPIQSEPEDKKAGEVKRGRGRPRKIVAEEDIEVKPKRGRGRPRKQVAEVPNEQEDMGINEQEKETHKQSTEDIDLFDLDGQEDVTPVKEDVNLFDLDENDNEEQEDDIGVFDIEKNTEQEDEDVDLFNMGETEEDNNDYYDISEPEKDNYLMPKANNNNSSYDSLLTGNKKIVAFVGTTKNGTSFVVNNTAELLSEMGIDTAVLDMTKTKNSYYIYTNDDEKLRTISRSCMEKLEQGEAAGLKPHKNLSIYTEMPGEEKDVSIEKILTTLLNNHTVVMIDTDFDTSAEIFEKAQEIYLVQSMDVLTIQPLTAFLRNLKSKGVLKPERLRVVINKYERVKSLSAKTIIGGMANYNSPSMTYMTELFDKDKIKYCEIPFEVQNYVKYLESLVICSISLNGYTKVMMDALKELANMVYPLVNRTSYSPLNSGRGAVNNDPFSEHVNNTLNEMKKHY